MVKTKKIKRRTKKTLNRRIKRTNKKMSKRINRTKKRIKKRTNKKTSKKIQNNRRMKNKRIHKLVRTNAINPYIQTGGSGLNLSFETDPEVDVPLTDINKTKYEIDKSKLLGSGGSADVYQGTYGGEPVAIKEFGDEIMYGKAIKGFQKSMVDCPEAPGILSTKLNGFIDTHSASNVIIIDRYPGMELFEYITLSDTTISADLINKIASDILLQIICLHDRNLVHRDIKPENIIFDNESWESESGDKEKILARLIDWDMTEDSMGSGVTGTPVYWSPELADIRGKIDLKPSDMFAFGVCLYVLCCVRYPWSQDKPTKIILKKRSSDSMDPFKTQDIPDFKPLIKSLLSADPKSRPTARKAYREIFRMPKQTKAPPVGGATGEDTVEATGGATGESQGEFDFHGSLSSSSGSDFGGSTGGGGVTPRKDPRPREDDTTGYTPARKRAGGPAAPPPVVSSIPIPEPAVEWSTLKAGEVRQLIELQKLSKEELIDIAKSLSIESDIITDFERVEDESQVKSVLPTYILKSYRDEKSSSGETQGLMEWLQNKAGELAPRASVLVPAAAVGALGYTVAQLAQMGPQEGDFGDFEDL